jgi:transposase
MIKLIDKQKIIINFNKGLSRRQIEKELHIGRKTVSRYIKEYERKKNKLTCGATGNDNSLLIEDIVEKPKYDSSGRKKIKLN